MARRRSLPPSEIGVESREGRGRNKLSIFDTLDETPGVSDTRWPPGPTTWQKFLLSTQVFLTWGGKRSEVRACCYGAAADFSPRQFEPLSPCRNHLGCCNNESSISPHDHTIQEFGHPNADLVAEQQIQSCVSPSMRTHPVNQNVNTFHGPFSLSVSGCPIGFTSMSSFFRASTTP